MRYGLILAKTGAQPPNITVDKIMKVDGVVDVYAVFGRFDLVIFIKAEDYYKLKDSVRVGQVSNMYTIAEELMRAGKVIAL